MLKPSNIIYVIALMNAIFLLASCASNKSVVAKTSVLQSWTLIDVDPNFKHQVKILNFDAKYNGKFVVQLISATDNDNEIGTSEIRFNGNVQSEILKKQYVIESGSVYEFETPINISDTGLNKLILNTPMIVQQIRIIPHRSNPIGTGKYHKDWLKMHQSVEKQQALQRFKDARFGMFIHWGLYSQAGGIWKDTRIENSPYPGPKVAEWLMSTFRIPRNEYHQLANTFNPNKSFAQNIARLAKNAGMKYVVITAKHHDGFALFNSAVSAFDIQDATPYQGDLIKELYDACLAEGLDFGVYYSHGNDWNDGTDGNYANVKKEHDKLGIYTHPLGKNLWDPSANSHAEYLHSKAYPQIRELLTMLPKLRLIWFDGDGFITEQQAFDFYQLVYDINPNVLVNRRVGYQFGDYLDAGDNVIPSATTSMTKHWETVGTTNNSWGYKAYDEDWKSTKELLYYLIDILSKGGNYLLNIGPDGKGHIPATSVQRLTEIGQWIKTNSDAIYGTTRWKITHEGAIETLLSGTDHRESTGFTRKFSTKDFWFTAKQNKVYVISLATPEDTVRIRAMNNAALKIKEVRLLGSDEVIRWHQTQQALEIDTSAWQKNENGFVLEVNF